MTADRLLRVLRGGGVLTATNLMAATGLSRTAVHDVTGDLLELGLIEEIVSEGADPARRNGRGRPARRYRFAAEAGILISIDLGVHNVKVVVTDLRGSACAEIHRHLDDPASIDRATLLEDLVNEALSRAGRGRSDVRVVAVGVPIAMSPNTAIHYPHYQRVIEVSQRWAEAHGWPVLVENDANLAALGECRAGVAQGVDNIIVLLAGERLGAGIVAGGSLVRGAHGSAGELRFVSLMPDVQPEYLGIALQTRQLAERALNEGYATPGLRLAVDADGGRVVPPSVFRAAALGDESAAAIVRTVCERLARLIGVLATLLDPDLVVIAGGIAEAGEGLATTTQQLLPGWMIDNPPRIAVSTLGADAVVAGGISLALDFLEAHVLDNLRR